MRSELIRVNQSFAGQSIRVQYMDQNAAPNGGLYYDFPPDQTEAPRITLLYRPGHYDLVYRR